jgi:hypothetical protein
VRGEPGTGMRFTKRLVREMVTGTGDITASLDLANAVGDDAAAVAQRCASVLSAKLPGVAEGRGLTTSQRDLRDDVVPELARELARVGTGQIVWLVLEGLDAAGGESFAAVRDLVLTLLRHLTQVPSLRLVLVGWPEVPPRGFETSVEELLPPTAEDVAAYVLPPGATATDLVPVIQPVLAGIAAEGVTGYLAALRVVEYLRPVLREVLAPASGQGDQS